jgi:glyoxylase-like metal-dependent hydrolase (beta-lactamase superfamily II)
MKICRLYLNCAGYCLAKASHAVKGDPTKDIRFRALFGLILHPDLGWVLFDTGYTRKFYRATRFFPNKLYAILTKVFVEEKDELQFQLQQAGILPDEVKHVIISHFHADHIGGLKDFKNARFYCSNMAWQQAKSVSNFLAFSKGLLKDLIPDDFAQRVSFIEESIVVINDDIFGKYYDIFGDHSILAFNMPGHAAGQVGIKLKTHKQTYMLVADACWDKRSYKHHALPSPIVKLFFDSWSDYKTSILKLKNYHELNPEHIIVPSHCYDSYQNLISNTIDLDVL